MEYSVSFTAGALMRSETEKVIRAVKEGSSLDEVDPDVLDVHSRRGRERKTEEVVKRLKHVDRRIWDDFLSLTAAEQSITLYYACLKTYRLMFDFHMDVVLPRWQTMEHRLEAHDARRFLERRADAHPEVDTWSQSTWEKIRQVLLKMLTEAGLLQDGIIVAPSIEGDVWERFVYVGDLWFLEAALLNERRRDAITREVLS